MAESNAPPSQIRLGMARASNKGLWIAIGLGIVASLSNMAFVGRVRSNRITVLKTKARLAAGSKVNTSEFVRIDVYSDDLNELKALVVEDKDFGAITQIPLAEAVEPGQLLLQSSFAYGGQHGIRESIGPDERAIALHVKDEWKAVAYFVRPGDVVDVWAGEPTVQNIMTGATVRAVGDATIVPGDFGGRDAHYRTITVVVKTDDVKEVLQRLNMAKDQAVTLALAGSVRP